MRSICSGDSQLVPFAGEGWVDKAGGVAGETGAGAAAAPFPECP